MRRGLPRGSTKPPVLYSIYTEGIAKNVDVEIQIRQFAENIAVYTRVEEVEQTSKRETFRNKCDTYNGSIKFYWIRASTRKKSTGKI